ncbi:cyclodeaminase/cyclohydrolase family protein [Herbiconiux sp. YIM B11900]|uniref:cyclodeaminase/cyclohydrolase family protein n=1 Tax=Herbiconiux sp. YIM B11900 TaxID=3404131 RepID=UPI003F85DFAA
MTSEASTPPAVSTAASTVADWAGGLAEPVPNPGGGAAAGVMLSIAAALLSMVAGYTEPADGERRAELAGLESRAVALREEALRLADADAEASRAFAFAYRLPAGAERDEAIRTASIAAAVSAARLGDRAVEAVPDAEWLAEWGNPALIADVAVAGASLRAAVSSARTNVGVDLVALLGLGDDRDTIRAAHPELWGTIPAYDQAIERIDRLIAGLDARVVATHV